MTYSHSAIHEEIITIVGNTSNTPIVKFERRDGQVLVTTLEPINVDTMLQLYAEFAPKGWPVYQATKTINK